MALDTSPVADKRHEHRQHEDGKDDASDKPNEVHWVDMGEGAI